MHVDHTAILVSDLEQSKEFYLDGIGLEPSREFEFQGRTNYYVTGETDSEIQLVFDPSVDEAPAPEGIVHIALVVDDVERAVQRIVEATGCPVKTEPTTVSQANAHVAFIEDPDGYVIELVQEIE
jgi:lactoylglutathione lyase